MKAKCNKCVRCKLITKNGFVECSYLAKLRPMVFEIPKYCPRFKKRVKQ